MPPPGPDVTALLLDLNGGGDATAMDRLLEVVYDELRQLARSQRRNERADHTLNTTALVHEAWLRLADPSELSYQNRAHFFGLAARSMRRVLVDYARARNRAKRGGGVRPLRLGTSLNPPGEVADEDVLALEEALVRLEVLDERMARVVECRFYGGLTVEETAAALDTSPATVKRDWATARAWLHRELGEDGEPR